MKKHRHRFITFIFLTGFLVWLMPSTSASEPSGFLPPSASARDDNDPLLQDLRVKPIIVRTPSMHIHYQIPSASLPYLERVELWYSPSPQGTWRFYDFDEDRRSPIRFIPPGEGSFRLLVLAVDLWQRRSYLLKDQIVTFQTPIIPPDTVGQVEVFVDHTPPQLYLYTPGPRMNDYRSDTIIIRWSGFDKHLQALPVRLYYCRESDGNWMAIGSPQPAEGQYEWRLPSGLTGPIIIKAEIEDKAGLKDVQLSGVINLSDDDNQAKFESEKQLVLRPTFAAMDRRARVTECFSKGNLHSQRMEWEQAVQAYQEALVIDPAAVAARVNLAHALFKMRRFEQAQEQYELCLQYQSDLQTARFGLAQTQISLKQYEQAQKTLAQLLEQDRRDWQAWLMHGDVAAQLGNREMALSSWEKAADDLSPVKHQALQRCRQFGF